ncbi:MAG: hypothetical protein PVG72_12110 [Gammaproteobacteria bacterium]
MPPRFSFAAGIWKRVLQLLSQPGFPRFGLHASLVPLLAVSGLLLLPQAGIAEVDRSLSRFNRIAVAISKEAEPVRAEFALAAISEMAAAHTTEAELARLDARRGSDRRDLLRWAGAVDAYAAELTAIGEALTPETVVGISIGADSSVYLNIAGRPVMLGTPSARKQGEFEQRIIDRFCATYRCEDIVSAADLEVARKQVQGQPPSWSFSQYAGPACSTADGLELQFQTMQDLRRKREICTRLVAELNLLLAAIDAEAGAGARVDWNRLEIRGSPNAEQQQVILNGHGDTLFLAVPGLTEVPDFLRRALPWVAARVKGESYRLVLLNADALVAPLLYPGSSSN